MTLSIRHKLFFTLLLSSGLVVAAMYGFMRWSFQQGLGQWLEARQEARLEQMAGRLAEIHAREGGWDGLLAQRQRWRQLMWDARPPGPPELEPPPGHAGRGMGHGMGGGMGARFALLDADRQVLFGHPDSLDGWRLMPIRDAGRVVGYLASHPLPPVPETLDARFAEGQGRALLLIALLVTIVSAALAWPLARRVTRPLRRLAEGTRALAAGRFETRVAVASRDELGDLARDFNDLAQSLGRGEEARRQWVADISHELRTPLAVLRGELEALQDGVRPLDQGAVTSLLAEEERLHRLVEDLYQLARSDLGTLSYRKESLDPLVILRDEVEAMAGEFSRRGITLELLDESGAPATLYADPDRLAQLFRNLLGNSLRYTDAPGRLTVRVALAPAALLMDFQDSPPGVPAEALPRLFERFYRVESSRNRAQGGAGLGLAICRNIVAAHGGRIEARPSPLGGLWLHLEFPRP